METKDSDAIVSVIGLQRDCDLVLLEIVLEKHGPITKFEWKQNDELLVTFDSFKDAQKFAELEMLSVPEQMTKNTLKLSMYRISSASEIYTVLITGLPRDIDRTMLEMCLANERYGGGKVSELRSDKRGRVIVTFQEHKVAQHISAAGTLQLPLSLCKHKVSIELFDMDAAPPDVSTVKIGGSIKAENKEMLQICLENPKYKGGTVVSLELTPQGFWLVEFEAADVAEEFADQKEVCFPRQLSVWPVPVELHAPDAEEDSIPMSDTPWVRLINLPKKCDLESLQMCLENTKYKGGDVEHMEWDKRDRLRVKFCSSEVAVRFASQSSVKFSDSIAETLVSVELYAPPPKIENKLLLLGADFDKEILEMKLYQLGAENIEQIDKSSDGYLISASEQDVALLLSLDEHKLKLSGRILQFKEYRKRPIDPRVVLVEDFPNEIQVVEMYFTNKKFSGGGSHTVLKEDSGTFILKFDKEEDARDVVRKGRSGTGKWKEWVWKAEIYEPPDSDEEPDQAPEISTKKKKVPTATLR